MLFDQRLLRRFQAIIGYALKNLQKQGRTLLLPILLPRQSDDDLSSYISFLFYFLVLVEKRLIIYIYYMDTFGRKFSTNPSIPINTFL